MADDQDFVPLTLSCRCQQLTVTAEVPSSSLPLPLVLCHCNTCNAVSGQVCVTVCALPKGSKPLQVEGSAKGYKTGPIIERYFCGTCGSSVYEDATGLSSGLYFLDSGAFTTGEVQVKGTAVPVHEVKEHIFVGDTADGGLRDWMTSIPAWRGWMNESEEIPTGKWFGSSIGDSSSGLGTQTASEHESATASSTDLHCSCKCGGVQFSISRPHQGSRFWASPTQTECYALPVKFPEHADWWMPVLGSKYNAYLCACNDCRLSSGFEVSAWAVIPRNNFRVAASARPPPEDRTTSKEKQEVSPENVNDLQAQSTMRDHESSPGCHRQFCGRCGATLSYFTEKMPNIINVSVGLMKGASGPRVEEWLHWQTNAVGHATAAQSQRFVQTLATGFEQWGTEVQDRNFST